MERYPLSWPEGWRRIPPAQRTRARFSKQQRHYSTVPGGSSWTSSRELSVYDAVQRVLKELAALGVLEGDAVVSTNIPVRLDGLPRSDAKAPADPGVAVYWQRPAERPRCMAIDRYDRVADNLAAIAATLEAMRAIERHGGAQILDRAFTGFDALPAPDRQKDWREVLGYRSGDAMTLDDARARYRALAAQNHPDRGGTHERMSEVNRAWDEAQEQLART